MLPKPERLILCATNRLAQSLRWQHDRAMVAAGATRWATLNTGTIAQWFGAVSEAALLRGATDSLLLRRVLDAFQEQLLWEGVIADSIPDYTASFFDLPGMAGTAAEANALMVEWGVVPLVSGADPADETQQFLRWRRAFHERCDTLDVIEPVRQREAVLALLERGAIMLPSEIVFAGFDNISPQERRLQQLLEVQGVAVGEWSFAVSAPESIAVAPLADPPSELRAVAQWAAAQLARNPDAQLGIVAPDLANARDALESVLDDALHPALMRPAATEAPRRYNFSLGKPLPRQALVATALDLIELACGSGEVAQSRIGQLLRSPYWSASIGEADARARLDAAMREHLAATTTLARLIPYVQWFDRAEDRVATDVADDDGAAEQGHTSAGALAHLLGHLAALENSRRQWRNKALASHWAEQFRRLLRNVGWPGERNLSSHEFQAREAFFEELGKLAALDRLLGDAAGNASGNISARDAHRRLTQLCNAHVFQAETTGTPQLQVVGMLEAGGMRFDALWVMGMTDNVWPPSPRPNPLLPAEQQRKVAAPNASAQVQLKFAESIHARLLQCAPHITFSYAHAEGATELRASPLLAPYLHTVSPEPVAGNSGFDRLNPDGAVWAAPLDDSIAPPVQAGEHVRGGTGLLRAQAICPAWAFYRYRLGAKKLQAPFEGLDAAARGRIVHDALRAFWQTTALSSALRAMSDDERRAAIDRAVGSALDQYDLDHRAEPLPPVFRLLERERLLQLLGNWLAVELQRELPFTVISCEESLQVDIEGIVCHLQIDRIDQLDDGRQIVIDYKTGAVGGVRPWAEMRITDPQLPIYAAIAQSKHGDGNADAAAAVAFGKVSLDESVFLGIAADDGLLPRVPGIDSRDGRKVFSAEVFADWQAVLRHWRASVEEIAHEVRVGGAAVMVDAAADLRYCDVLPLLRLAERRAQWEDSGEAAMAWDAQP